MIVAILGIVLLLGALALLRAIRNAPIGQEDEHGFHQEPTSMLPKP
jgi:hypothetical protein